MAPSRPFLTATKHANIDKPDFCPDSISARTEARPQCKDYLMIIEYEVRHFKNIERSICENQPLALSGVNLFIGKNSSGKSSLLQSIDFLKAFYCDSIKMYLDENKWDYRDITNLRKTQKKVTWYAKFLVYGDDAGNYGGVYELQISMHKLRYIYVSKEKLIYTPLEKNEVQKAWKNGELHQFKDKKSYKIIDREGRKTVLYSIKKQETDSVIFYQLPSSVATYIAKDPADSDKYPEILHFMNYVNNIKYASIFDVENLRQVQNGYAEDVGAKGKHFLPFLAYIKSNHPERFQKINRDICTMFDSITNIDVEGANNRSTNKNLVVYEDNNKFTGKQVSDGLLRILAIVAIKHSPNPPKLLLFEEPENGVHPRLVGKMIDVFSGMARRKPPNSIQVFLTSHSPYVLDHFREGTGKVYAMKRETPKAGASFIAIDQRMIDKLPDQPLGEAWYQNLLGGS